MTIKQIEIFISDNTSEDVEKYGSILLEKLKDLNKRNDRISLFLIVLTISFVVSSKATETSIQLGPLAIKDLTVFLKLLPPLFAFFLVEYALVNGHRAELLKVIKWSFLKKYKQQTTEEDYKDDHYPLFVRLLLPFSLWVELLKVVETRRPGCTTFLVFLPLVLLLIWPFYFEYLSIRNLANTSWEQWTTKVSIIATVYLNILFFYYYIRPLKDRLKDAKEDLKRTSE